MTDIADRIGVEGVYSVECRGPDGRLKWREDFHNTVVTVGLNQMLSASILGAGGSGPYAGLIDGSGFTGIAATDTMTSHPGWFEAGGANLPSYTGPRKTPTWTAPAGGVISWFGAQTFFITVGGLVTGAFQVFGVGASNVLDNTSGVLFSAGSFGIIQSVDPNDLVVVSYSLTI